MVKALVYSLLLVTVLAGLAIWRLNQTSDEHRIQQQLERLSDYVSKDGEESMTEVAAKMNRLAALFADSFTIDLRNFPANGIYSASEITSQAARIRPGFDTIQLRVLDSRITVLPPNRAVAVVTARLSVRPKNGETSMDIREITITLHRDENAQWRFSEFTEEAVIRR